MNKIKKFPNKKEENYNSSNIIPFDNEESLKDKFFGQNQAKGEKKYKKKLWVYAIICLLLLLFGILIIIRQRKIKTEKDSLIIKVNEFIKENFELKIKLKQLSKENIELNERLSKASQENIELKEKLSKANQTINSLLNGEFPLPEQKDQLSKFEKEKPSILCPICFDNIPSVSLFEEGGKVMVKQKCNECGNEESKEIGEYFSFLQNKNEKTYYCQKNDGSHSNRKATCFYSSKFFCEECANEFKKLVDPKDIKEIQKNENILNKVCKNHNRKFKYYCPICRKHYCDYISKDEHEHSNIIALEELTKKINLENYQNFLEKIEKYIYTELYEIKSKFIKKLIHMIRETELIYQKYANTTEYIVSLGKIFLENYKRSREYHNYYIFKNLYDMSKEMDNISIEKHSYFISYFLNNSIMEDNFNLFKSFTENIFYKGNKLSFFDSSNIIKTLEDIKLILSWVEKKEKVKRIELTYKASKDGDNRDAFYSKFPENDSTILLFETTTNRRFGAFFKSSRKNINEDGIVADPDAFLFSLDRQKVYPILYHDFAFSIYPEDLLVIGNSHRGDGIIIEEYFLNINSNYEDQHTKVYDVPSRNELTSEKEKKLGEKSYFTLKEMELYKIEFL